MVRCLHSWRRVHYFHRQAAGRTRLRTICIPCSLIWYRASLPKRGLWIEDIRYCVVDYRGGECERTALNQRLHRVGRANKSQFDRREFESGRNLQYHDLFRRSTRTRWMHRNWKVNYGIAVWGRPNWIEGATWRRWICSGERRRGERVPIKIAAWWAKYQIRKLKGVILDNERDYNI